MLLQYFPKVEPDPTTVYTRTFTPYPKRGSFFSACRIYIFAKNIGIVSLETFSLNLTTVQYLLKSKPKLNKLEYPQ